MYPCIYFVCCSAVQDKRQKLQPAPKVTQAETLTGLLKHSKFIFWLTEASIQPSSPRAVMDRPDEARAGRGTTQSHRVRHRAPTQMMVVASCQIQTIWLNFSAASSPASTKPLQPGCSFLSDGSHERGKCRLWLIKHLKALHTRSARVGCLTSGKECHLQA